MKNKQYSNDFDGKLTRSQRKQSEKIYWREEPVPGRLAPIDRPKTTGEASIFSRLESLEW